jgi:hypothetical protein
VGFEQAAIRIEKEKEFEELRGAIERTFHPEAVEKFLKRVQGMGLRVRDLDSILTRKLLDNQVAGKEASTRDLYQSLTLSDQAQMREFYLSKLEEVNQTLRTKFQKIYRYY